MEQFYDTGMLEFLLFCGRSSLTNGGFCGFKVSATENQNGFIYVDRTVVFINCLRNDCFLKERIAAKHS